MFLGLAIFGWMNIYGASYSFDQTSVFDFDYRSGKQLVWIATALLMGGFILLLDSKVFDMSAYVLYALMLLLLVATPFLARDIKGSQSWITIGPVSLQPAEFAKCITALALAKLMSRYDFRIRTWRDLIWPGVLLAIPMLIIMVMQKETGSALVFVSFVLMLYREGMSGSILLIGVAAVALFIIVIKLGSYPLPIGLGDWGMLVAILVILGIILFYLWAKDGSRKQALIVGAGILGAYMAAVVANIWIPVNFNWVSYGVYAIVVLAVSITSFINRHYRMFLVILFALGSFLFCHACDYVFAKVLQPHQRIRIEVLLGLKDDPQGAGYNVTQSLIAIGSGGFAGKGFLNGTQTKMNFVPEQATDFIFCTVGEEWGFLGSAALLLVYMFFILRLVFIAERQKDMFAQIYAYCVVGIFIFHLTINVGMVLGLLPVIGIPLPFISYGGSSMWGFTILLFILLRLDAARVEKM